MLALSHSASALNFAQADVGASIVASSPFHPRPNDANYLLRSSEVDGYAAGIESENTFHFIEIDLGQPRDFDSINIEWYDHESYATAYNVLERSCSDQVWVKLFSVSDNDKLRVSHRFDKVTARFVRIETVAYRGQNRFLARGLQILNAGLPAS
jgi:glycyl-tRNA synthetase alpha subunit